MSGSHYDYRVHFMKFHDQTRYHILINNYQLGHEN